MKGTFEYDIDSSWDVLIAGGGPSGCAAAIASAREGLRTLLIEATGALGGMGTSGLLPFWAPFSDGEKIIYRGIAEEVFNRNKNGQPQLKNAGFDWVAIDSEKLKVIYDDMVTESGAELLLYTRFIGTVMGKEGKVNHIITASKSGVRGINAKVFIDCTGDADLAVGAGAQYIKGDDKKELQPATLCFQLSNVDTFAYLYKNKLKMSDPTIKAIARDPKYPLIRSTHLYCTSLIGPGVVGLNSGHIWNTDGTDVTSLTDATIQGRKLVRQIQEALSEYYPKVFANAHLSGTASILGIRETRRIIGDYVLTLNDYLERKTFPDEICRNSYPVDIHESEDEINDVLENKLINDRRYDIYAPGESHGIPYRCLTPKNLTNVLVAGRSISTDRIVNGATRVMPVCLVLGEAAGIAASLAVNEGRNNVHSVNTDTLRKKMIGYGAYLPSMEGDDS